MAPGLLLECRDARGSRYFVFVYPYERYKKIAVRYPDRHLDPSEAFGLNRYSNQAQFRSDYPDAEILVWDDVAAHNKPSWFADCVRNSFAHAQTTRQPDRKERNEMVEMLNAPDGLTPNFQIKMRTTDFWKLIQQALKTFIRTVTAPSAEGKMFTLLQSLDFLLDELLNPDRNEIPDEIMVMRFEKTGDIQRRPIVPFSGTLSGPPTHDYHQDDSIES